jgi:hypothetical protein
MIGKTHWFQRRKYGGWGLFPKTWEGWLYIAVTVGLIVIIQFLPIIETARIILMATVVVILVLDVIDIMRKLPMDEREKIHEAISERNALWAVITALAVGVAYQAAISIGNANAQVDPVIIIALVAGVAAKAITNFYLDKKN